MTATASQYRFLEITDRVSGVVERIDLDDGTADDSVLVAANSLCMNSGRAWQVLFEGQTLTTAGFVRRLTK